MNDCFIQFKDNNDNIIYYGYYIEKEIQKINNDLLKEGLKKYKNFDWEKAKKTKTKRYSWNEKTKEFKKHKTEHRYFEIKDEKNNLKIYNMKYYFKRSSENL